MLSVLFGVLGSVISWSDETLGFYALMIPLFLALGYDRMVVVSVVTVAPFVGSIGATVNPFRIGVASDAAGVSMGDGLGLRAILLVAVMAVTIAYTLRYAARVKANPQLALVPHDPEDFELVEEAERDDLDTLTGRHKLVLGILTFTFLLMIFSIVPWGDPRQHARRPDHPPDDQRPVRLGAGLVAPSSSALLVMALVVGIAARLGEAATSKAFIQGVVDFTGPAVLVVFARAVSILTTPRRSTRFSVPWKGSWAGGRASCSSSSR